MKKLNDNHLDKLFRDGLTDPKAPVAYREADWKDMAALLDGKSGKKGGVIPRIGYYLSGIAALLLLAFGLLFLTKNEHPDSLRRKSPGGNLVTKQGVKEVAKEPGTPLITSSQIGANKPLVTGPSTQQKPSIPNYAIIPAPLHPALQQHANTVLNDFTLSPADKISLTAATALPDSGVQLLAINQITDTAAVMPDSKPVPKRSKQEANSGIPTFALTLLGAPDLNTVNSLNGGQVGSNISLQLTVKLTPKLSITTGAAYAIKPYQSSFAEYTTNFNPAAQPTNVSANCQVLDIPININYQLYAKGSNSFTLGTGLSSYFMLKEKYRFDYAEDSGVPTYNLNFAGQNQHLFGVLNLNATYHRKLNPKFSAVVQPYFKLPLTGIGNGQVNLKSTGVAIGFNWNINLLKKPK
jgi:hypothetical protein